MNLLSKIAAGATVFFAASAANASFVTGTAGGDTVIYDSTNDITWIQNGLISGNRTWADAQSWAANLIYAGNTGWRVATIQELTSIDNPAYFGFSNGQAAGSPWAQQLYFGRIWSSTENSSTTASGYYYAEYYSGAGIGDKSNSYGAFAVHSGDLLTPSAVPIPAAAWLMASGLGVFGAAARKRRAKAA